MKTNKFLAALLATFALVACEKNDTTNQENQTEEQTETTPQTSELAGVIFINEVDTAGDDWIELYNSSDKAISLAGFQIYDDGGAAKGFTFGDVTIASKGFLVLVKNADNSFTFGLSNSGDTLTLLDADGGDIDYVEIVALSKTQSYGRTTDGGSEWTVFTTQTQGESNLFEE